MEYDDPYAAQHDRHAFLARPDTIFATDAFRDAVCDLLALSGRDDYTDRYGLTEYERAVAESIAQRHDRDRLRRQRRCALLRRLRLLRSHGGTRAGGAGAGRHAAGGDLRGATPLLRGRL